MVSHLRAASSNLRLLVLAVILSTAWPPAAVSAQTVAGTSPAGLFYEVSGSGDPVVLIHAFGVDRRMWETQVAEFESRFRVIRYDLRGHGRSVAPTEPYTGYGDLRALLDTLGISRLSTSVRVRPAVAGTRRA